MRKLVLIFVFNFFIYNIVSCQYWSVSNPSSSGIIFNYDPIDTKFGIGIAHNFKTDLVLIIPKRKKPSFFARNIKPKALVNFSYIMFPSSGIQGLNFGFMASGIAAFGLNFNYYKYKNLNQFAFCPEIGISYSNVDLLYGYNLYLTRTRIREIRQHLITIRLYIPIFKQKTEDAVK